MSDYRRTRLVDFERGIEKDTIRGYPRFSGTGFFVDSLCTIVTAAHVLANLDTTDIQARLDLRPDGDKIFARSRILWTDPTRDIAFLRVENCPSDHITHLRLSEIPYIQTEKAIKPNGDTLSLANFGYPEMKEGDEVLVLGYPGIKSAAINTPVPGTGTILKRMWLEENVGFVILLEFFNMGGFSGSPAILSGTNLALGIVEGYPADLRPAYQLNRSPRPHLIESDSIYVMMVTPFSYVVPVTMEDYRAAIKADSTH